MSTTSTTIRTGRWVFSPLDCAAHLTPVEGDQMAATAEQELEDRQLVGWRCPNCRAIFVIDSATADELLLARHDE